MSGRPTSPSGASAWSSTNATWTPSSGSIRASRDRLAERKTNNWAEVPYHGAPALFYSRSSPYNRHSPHLGHVRGELSRGRPPARQPVPLFACRGHWQRVRDCGFLRGGVGIPLTSRTTYKKFPTRPLFGRAHSYARIPYSHRGRAPPIKLCKLCGRTLKQIILCGRSSAPVSPRRYRGVGKQTLFSELPRETVWKVLSGCSGGLRSALWRAKDTLRICPTMNGVASVRICLVPQGKDAPGFTAYGRS